MGSDFPVERVNPFYGIHAAVTRQNAANEPPVCPIRQQWMALHPMLTEMRRIPLSRLLGRAAGIRTSV